jgi:hypothetical protein
MAMASKRAIAPPLWPLLLFALLNGTLYAALLPLWEGFDEPFHFAYVQSLADARGLPDVRTATVSEEVAESIALAPASPVVHQNLPQAMTYREYFSFAGATCADIQRRLRSIPVADRSKPSTIGNYEAHQPPLAYLLLALPERVMATRSLPSRVLALRLIAAWAGALLLFTGAEGLFTELGLEQPFRFAALFCLFSAQMIWASIAHVSNDWLAIPLAAWLLLWMIRGSAIGTGGALGLGLLVKAYFLVFVPLALLVWIWCRRWRELAVLVAGTVVLGGPWYWRNWSHYGELTGTQEARGGVGIAAVWYAIPAVPWLQTMVTSAHQSLWTGNNSFLSFSAWTIDFILALLLIAVLSWVWVAGKSTAQWITALFSFLFLMALGYSAVSTFVFTHGAGAWPSPWYTQVLTAPLLGLAFLGASRKKRAGRALAALLSLAFGYVIVATYWVKLIPLYGGYEGRGNIAAVFSAGLAERLDSVALAPSWLILTMAGGVLVLTAVQQVLIIRALVGSNV